MTTRGEAIAWIKNRAVEYRKIAVDSINRNDHMNSMDGKCRLTQDEVDAMLTDFVNYCGAQLCLDYGMYTKDLAEDAGDMK